MSDFDSAAVHHPIHFKRLSRIALSWRAVIWAAISAAFTMMIVQYSLRNGRLVLPPAYDDVGYLADAAVRLREFYESGLLPVFKAYLENPPHSPYSTLLAVIGFVVFGIREWSPYAANGLLMIVYLAFADHLLRGLKLWQRLLGTIVMLTVPLTVMAVHEFRPDHACALLTAIGGILILEKPLLTASIKRLSFIGSVWGLALLTKTSTFPATLAMMVGTLFLGTVTDLLIVRNLPKRAASKRSLLWKVPRAWGLCAGLAILVAVPHFAFAWREIYAYIVDNVFGARKDIWKTVGPWSYHLYYYIDPDYDNNGGGQMLGRHVYLLYGLLTLSAIVTLLRPSRKIVIRSIALFLFLLGTYFVVAVGNQIKTVFFGLTFQTTFMMLGIATLRQVFLVQKFRTPRVPWAVLILIGALIVGFGEFRWPRRVGRYYESASTARRDIAEGIYNTLLKDNPAAGGKVVIEGIGDINPALFQYYNARDQHDFTFFSSVDSPDLAPHLLALVDASYLILSEPDTMITADFLLGYRVLPAMNAEIQRRREWKQIGHFIFPPSKRGFFVFKRSLVEFTGWDKGSETGLMKAEGPYLDWGLPIVRWGLGPETTFRFTAPAKPVELTMSIRNEWAGEQIEVYLDQKLLWTKSFAASPSSTSFETAKVSLPVPPGSTHQLRIKYGQYHSEAEPHRAVLYQELSVLPR